MEKFISAIRNELKIIESFTGISSDQRKELDSKLSSTWLDIVGLSHMLEKGEKIRDPHREAAK